MSHDIFFQAHIDGNDQPVQVSDIVACFSPFVVETAEDSFVVKFSEGNESRIYLDAKKPTASHFCVNRPCFDPRLNECLFKAALTGNFVSFEPGYECAFVFDERTSAAPGRYRELSRLSSEESIRDGNIALVWSYVLDFENDANPFEDRKSEIGKWKTMASEFVKETPDLIERANQIGQLGFKAVDSLHIAAALSAGCSTFVTTDDAILKKSKKVASLRIINPVQFFTEEIE